ncbi:hypothetical protein KNE206_78450 [Kitasatospora sp. NE20-6]
MVFGGVRDRPGRRGSGAARGGAGGAAGLSLTGAHLPGAARLRCHLIVAGRVLQGKKVVADENSTAPRRAQAPAKNSRSMRNPGPPDLRGVCIVLRPERTSRPASAAPAELTPY